MRPQQGLEPCQRHVQAQRERQNFILLACRRMGTPAASIKEPEKREFVVDSGACMHMVSKRDLNSAELETLGTSRILRTVMTANGEVRTREDATVHVKEIGPIRDGYSSRRNSRSSFSREAL